MKPLAALAAALMLMAGCMDDSGYPSYRDCDVSLPREEFVACHEQVKKGQEIRRQQSQLSRQERERRQRAHEAQQRRELERLSRCIALGNGRNPSEWDYIDRNCR